MSETTKLDDFTRAYIEAMLWSSTGDYIGDCSMCDATEILLTGCATEASEYTGDVCFECRENYPSETQDRNADPPLDKYLGIDDLAPKTLERIVKDCREFQGQNTELLVTKNLTHGHRYSAEERGGHDFWLTRNGHGCGFWDGDWSEPAATVLDNASKKAGGLDLYAGDDGKLYFW